MDQNDVTRRMTTALNALSNIQIIAETTAGYHRKLIEGGVGQETADRMSEKFHDALIEMAIASVRTQARSTEAEMSRGAQPRR